MPLQFVKDNVNIDFIGKRRIGFLISALCIIADDKRKVFNIEPFYRFTA